jgi:hypothetical protein
LALLLLLRLLPALHRTGLRKAFLLQAHQQQHSSSHKLAEHLLANTRRLICLELLVGVCWRHWLLTLVVGSWLQQQKP